MARGDRSSMTSNNHGRSAPKRFDALLSVWRPVARRLQLPDDGTWLVLAVCCGIIAAVGILSAAFLDPEQVSWFPKCPIHNLTGLDCPGCGTARAVHAAAHGKWVEAIRFNPILVVTLPFLAVSIARPSIAKKTSVAWCVFIVAVGWMIVRNLIR